MSCLCLSDCQQLLAPASVPDSCGVAVLGQRPGFSTPIVCRARSKKSIVLVVQNSGTVFLVARQGTSRHQFFFILDHLRLTSTRTRVASRQRCVDLAATPQIASSQIIPHYTRIGLGCRSPMRPTCHCSSIQRRYSALELSAMVRICRPYAMKRECSLVRDLYVPVIEMPTKEYIL